MQRDVSDALISDGSAVFRDERASLRTVKFESSSKGEATNGSLRTTRVVIESGWKTRAESRLGCG